ncbi:MAG: RtcB family protein [Pseudobdellovibrionaceae bacterium]
MDIRLLEKVSNYEWHVAPHQAMKVPAIFFGSEELLKNMDEKAYQQLCNVATLPGIVKAAFAMPDAHWGYGFPIGGVAAFDPEEGVISAGGVGFDISCGVRLLTTGLPKTELEKVKDKVIARLFKKVPAGVGSHGVMILESKEMDRMLMGGAKWAVQKGYGLEKDLERIEEHGQMQGAVPAEISPHARERQRDEMGTLGSGNHYLELQEVNEILDETAAGIFGLKKGEVVISIHCGSRGLGHQIGTEFLKMMVMEAERIGLFLPDRELACVPIQSQTGQSYLGAMRAAINCALANRQIITHLVREVFKEFFPSLSLNLVYDVSHNTCKEEVHTFQNTTKKLFVHRKGATRAFGPGHEELPVEFREIGQPVLIGGSMGTGSYVLRGTKESESTAFSSASHGAGRQMSRSAALKTWTSGRKLVDELAHQGILVKSISDRGISEEAPGAYKDIHEVALSTESAHLANKVAFLTPLACIKG